MFSVCVKDGFCKRVDLPHGGLKSSHVSWIKNIECFNAVSFEFREQMFK